MYFSAQLAFFWVRMEEQNLLSEVTYCGTDREVYARLMVNPKTLIHRKRFGRYTELQMKQVTALIYRIWWVYAYW